MSNFRAHNSYIDMWRSWMIASRFPLNDRHTYARFECKPHTTLIFGIYGWLPTGLDNKMDGKYKAMYCSK